MRISDEKLDHLADTFLALQIRELIGISFEQFLTNQPYYQSLALALQSGDGLNFHDGRLAVVTLH